MTRIYFTDCSVLENEEMYKHYYDLLPYFRKESVDRYLQKNDKFLSVGAWTLLNAALDNKIGGGLRYGENGKPYFENSSVKFNLSHSGAFAMCAVSDFDIGCDVEMIKDAGMRVAKRFFYSDEITLLENAESEEDRKKLFFRLWTLKESFMKVTGLGFKLNLSDFCVYFKNGAPKVRHAVDEREYFFKEYFINEKYAFSACAAEKDDLPESIISVDL